MAESYRTGRTIQTTIYRENEAQPFCWVPGDPETAARIVSLLNRERSHAKADHVAGARYESLLAVQAKALEAQAKTIAELEEERAALSRALFRESSDNLKMRVDATALIEQAEALQQANVRFAEKLAANAEENARLAEENAVLKGSLAFPVNVIVNENISLKRALAEKGLTDAVAESTAAGR